MAVGGESDVQVVLMICVFFLFPDHWWNITPDTGRYDLCAGGRFGPNRFLRFLSRSGSLVEHHLPRYVTYMLIFALAVDFLSWFIFPDYWWNITIFFVVAGVGVYLAMRAYGK